MGNCNSAPIDIASDEVTAPKGKVSNHVSNLNDNTSSSRNFSKLPFSKETVKITKSQKELLEKALKSLSFIKKGCELSNYFSILTKEVYEKGSVVVNEGDLGEKLFIIEVGTLSATVNGDFFRSLSSGESFGEQALMYNTHYAMKVR